MCWMSALQHCTLPTALKMLIIKMLYWDKKVRECAGRAATPQWPQACCPHCWTSCGPCFQLFPPLCSSSCTVAMVALLPLLWRLLQRSLALGSEIICKVYYSPVAKSLICLSLEWIESNIMSELPCDFFEL